MLDYSVSYFLGDYWSNTPLYAEKLIPLLDYTLSNNFAEDSKMSSAFYELINKYQNTADLPIENIKEYIKENGYEYILNLLNPNEEDLKILVYLIVLIHQLKGSEVGIKTVLSLFQLNAVPEDTQIIQWYQTLPVAEENTFSIDSKVDISKAGDNFYSNFSNFIKNYVYPELLQLKIRYALQGGIIQIPYITTKVTYTANAVMST